MRRDRKEAGLDEGDQRQPIFGVRMRGFLHGPVVEFLDHGLVAGRCGHAGPCRRGAAPYAARVPRSRAEACGAETKKRRDRPRTAPAQPLTAKGARDRAEERRLGEEWVSTLSAGWPPTPAITTVTVRTNTT